MKAMIFAAGLGTRLRPLTNDRPKALVEYRGKPLLQHVLERLKSYGFTDIVINIHHFAGQIIEFLENNRNFGLNIKISDERDSLLDTGGGLYKAKDLLGTDEPFLVHNVDIISDLDLGTFYRSFNPARQIALLATGDRQSDRKLIFSQKTGYLCGWKNLKTGEQIIARKDCPAPLELAFNGIHVISPRIFNYMQPGKYSIIKTYLEIAGKENIGYYLHTGQWKDMGRPEAFVS